ncbi:MAG: asparagine synthetase B family protein, partial [Planctomycetota bacterium]
MEGALDALAPRGPDGTGRSESPFGDSTFRYGVRRLELVDGGQAAQPVVRPSGACCVFNGEIYNHAALRRALEADGEFFRTGGDAEVLTVLLERRGIQGLAAVEGSYAFAFLASPKGPLLLGRDPLGVRPLVVAAHTTGLVFASTLDAILATGALRAEPDLDALADVLRDGVIGGAKTALRGVRRVAPGEVLEVDTGLNLFSQRVPEALPVEATGVLAALRSAVTDRLQSHRPSAVFLSGGVDSALVAALARENSDVTAYTLTFPGAATVDETHRAQRTARRLGIEQVEVPCPRDPTPWVLGTARAFDEPFADASAVPTWGLAMAAGRRVRVALTGTGGDEVFGGYRRYWLLGAGPWLRHVPAFVRQPLSAILRRSMPRGARLMDASRDPHGLYRGLLRIQPLDEMKELLGPRLEQAADLQPRPGPRTAQEAMALDLVNYLPNDLLVKEDR